MPPSLLNPYLRRTMGAAVVRLPIQSSFLRDTLFSRSFVFGTPDIDIDLVMPRRGIAPFVHPSLPGKTMGNTGFTMKSYTPPYVKPKRIITAADIFKRAPGIDIYQESDALNGVLAELLGERRDVGVVGDEPPRRVANDRVGGADHRGARSGRARARIARRYRSAGLS